MESWGVIAIVRFKKETINTKITQNDVLIENRYHHTIEHRVMTVMATIATAQMFPIEDSRDICRLH